MTHGEKRIAQSNGSEEQTMQGQEFKKPTYQQIVEQWARERERLQYVQPYTARKAEQKALLFAPWIAETPLDKIEPAQISEALMHLGAKGGRSRKGLSTATLRAAHLAGSQAADWAVARGLASKNPFKGVARPRANYRQSQFLTQGQANKLARAASRSFNKCLASGDVARASFSLAVCLAIATGLRRGEIFALDWDDFNEKTMRISVNKAIKGDGSLGRPKTVASVRNVAIGEKLCKLLQKMRAWQEEHFPEKDWSQSTFIMCGEDGGIASLNAFEHWWRAWANRGGWKGLRFHELRHTHATLLISNGTDVKTVQMRLGHSSAEVTMSCYAHALPMADGSAATMLDSTLFSR